MLSQSCSTARPQDMQEDFDARGYCFEWCRLDSQEFLLRQRRNRVWATADVSRGQDSAEYGRLMLKTVRSLASEERFPFEETFDMSRPAEPNFLKTDLAKGRISIVVGKAKNNGKPDTNLFIDCATSSSWGGESAHEVTPCIRPSHAVWSTKMGRPVHIDEMFLCQGLFESAFPCPAALHSILKQPKQAQDLCGNSFSSTVVQVKLMASLAHSLAWKVLASSQPSVDPDVEMVPLKDSAEGDEPHSFEDLPGKADSNHSSHQGPADEMVRGSGQKRQASELPDGACKFRRRLKGKICCPGYTDMAILPATSQSRSLVGQKKKERRSRRGRPRNTSVSPSRRPRKRRAQQPKPPSADPPAGPNGSGEKTEGKKVGNKTGEFESVKQNPDIRNPEAWMLRNSKSKGLYQGCFSESKWLGRSRKYKWDLFVQCAEKMAKKMCEVPNVLRPILGIETLKGMGRLNPEKTGSAVIPPELLSAFETMVLDRVSAGEEVTRSYLKNLLLNMSQVWNEHIEAFRQDASAAVGQWALKQADQNMQDDPTSGEVERAQKVAVEAMKESLASLLHYRPSLHIRALEHLGLKALKAALGLETGDGSDGCCGNGVRPAQLNAAGHQVPVDNARVARTTTTLSWSDGQAALF
eukprot:s286_g25.t1